jgi:hypothetical protein
MTRAEARVILDCLRAGDDFPPEVIELALVLTGDLAPTNWRMA